MIVDLEPWEYTWASHVGAGRFTANWGKADAAYYDKKRMEDDRTAQVAAAICELAVAKAFNRYWPGHVWHASDHHKYRDVPDVCPNIEVRRVRTGKGAAVRQRQLGKGLVLVAVEAVAPEFRQVDIWGWLSYDRAWEIGGPSSYSDDTRIVARSDFITTIPGQTVGEPTERK